MVFYKLTIVGTGVQVGTLIYDVLTDSSWDDMRPAVQLKGDRSSTRQMKSSNGSRYVRHLAEERGEDEPRPGAEAKEDSALSDGDLPEPRTGEDVKVTLQRVLEARAILANKLENDARDVPSSTSLETVQEDASTKSTINMAREVLAGFRKGSVENGRVSEASTADDGNGVQDWSASLIRSGLSKPLAAKGSPWRRELGTVHDLHCLTDQPDVVRKVGCCNRKRYHFLISCCCGVV